MFIKRRKLTKGFTLVELLAVIVILAIILAIAVPTITGIIKKATKNAFEQDAKMVLKTIDFKVMQDPAYDVETINVDKIKTDLKLGNENYANVFVIRENKDLRIIILGKNKWAGLIAAGTYKNIKVEATEDFNFEPTITLVGANPVSIVAGDEYIETGATAVDFLGRDITENINIDTSNVNNTEQGEYYVIYSVIDKAGNQKIINRIVYVTRVAGAFVMNTADSTIITEPNGYVIGDIYEFNYTNSADLIWEIPVSGIYKMEVAGASGVVSNKGGKGALVEGEIELNEGQELVFKIHSIGNGGGNGGLTRPSCTNGSLPTNPPTNGRGFRGSGGTLIKVENDILIAAGGAGGNGVDGEMYNSSYKCGIGGAGGGGGDLEAGLPGSKGTNSEGKNGNFIGGAGGASTSVGGAGGGGGAGGRSFIADSVVNFNVTADTNPGNGYVKLELIGLSS